MARYRALPGAEAGRKVGVFRHRGRRLVVAYSPRRARKDAADRQRAVRKLLKQLNRSGQPKSLVPRGAARFVRMKGKGRWEIDPDRIAETARWDGLHGVATNVRGMPIEEILERYRGLWQVERSFRITKHDLKVRPIYHWTPRRIRAHLAIAYMAFACVRHLALPDQAAEKTDPVPRSDPRRAAEPPVFGAAPHRHRPTLRDSVFGHGRSPTDLRGPGPDAVGRPLCVELNRRKPAQIPEVVPSEFVKFKNINDLRI